jgi:hypothetical protein
MVRRLFLAGGGGLILVVATAVIYNPTVPPAEQAFHEGLSKSRRMPARRRSHDVVMSARHQQLAYLPPYTAVLLRANRSF